MAHAIMDLKNNIRGEHFDSFEEFFKIGENRQFNRLYTEDFGSLDAMRAKEGIKDFSWEESKKAIMFGSEIYDSDFETAYEKINKRMEKAAVRYERARNSKDVVGQSVLVERALMGHPRAFNRRVCSQIKQKAITLFYNPTCRWRTTVQERLESGCLLMAIAKTLESMGYQTAIVLTPYFTQGKKKNKPSMIVEIPIKDFKTRFNKKKLQFPVASMTVLFHAGCWWHHRTPEAQENFGTGEGVCVDYNEKPLQAAKNYCRDKKGIYLSTPMMLETFKMDVNKTLDYVIDEIKAMG